MFALFYYLILIKYSFVCGVLGEKRKDSTLGQRWTESGGALGGWGWRRRCWASHGTLVFVSYFFCLVMMMNWTFCDIISFFFVFHCMLNMLDIWYTLSVLCMLEYSLKGLPSFSSCPLPFGLLSVCLCCLLKCRFICLWWGFLWGFVWVARMHKFLSIWSSYCELQASGLIVGIGLTGWCFEWSFL